MPVKATKAMPLDPIRQLIADRIEEQRLNMKAVSKEMGRNDSYIHQYLYRRQPQTLKEDDRHALARILGLPEETLRPGSGGRIASASITQPGKATRPARPAALGGVPRMEVPIFPEDAELDPLSATETVERFPVLGAAPGVFAIWVSRSHGRLRPGDLAFCRPGHPARAGDIVVVVRDRRIVAAGDVTGVSDDTVEVAGKAWNREDNQIVKVVAAWFP